MVFLIVQRFLFSLVMPLATTMQHFPPAKTSTKTSVFLMKAIPCFVRMIFKCVTAKFCHLWLQNIANTQHESSQQFTLR